MDLRKPLYDIEKEAEPATVCVTGTTVTLEFTTKDALAGSDGVSSCLGRRRHRLHCRVSASPVTPPHLLNKCLVSRN